MTGVKFKQRRPVFVPNPFGHPQHEAPLRILLLLLALLPCSTPAAETFVWFRTWKDAEELARVLRSVPEGRAVLAKAEARDAEILRRVQRGSASLTTSLAGGLELPFAGADTSPERQGVIINRGLSLADAAADLAHELTHFARKRRFDPYTQGFALGDFVRAGIEGPGGELDAFETECQVAWALEREHPAFPRHQACEKFREKGAFARERARRGYYALGRWEKRFDEWKKELPELSAEAVVFRGGVSGQPYPLALAEELPALRRAACENNAVRYELVPRAQKNGRKPLPDEMREERERLKRFHEQHCLPKKTDGAKP